MNNQDNNINSKSLAKNTLFLYFRMLLTMAINLYISRVILHYLGVVDFGIYNAVYGAVFMFAVVSGTLSTSISRSLTFELARGNTEKLNKVFSMSINIQLMLIVLFVFLGETIAVWFMNSKMVIPEERMVAANWVLQFAILSIAVEIFCSPYSASVIAHEKMDTYACVGIIESVLKLAAVYLLVLSPVDRLIFYGFLLLCVAFIIQGIYIIYCKWHFEECTYHFIRDKEIFKELFGFASWNLIGASSGLLSSIGLNVLLNVFFGPIVNAARAISIQVNNGVNNFVKNFMFALTPQITKAYAQSNYSYLLQCIYRGSKFSFFLLFFLSLPVFVETDYILRLWLVDVPDSTVWFVRYILLYSLADTYSRALILANNATGDIKMYEIVVGGINLTVLPIAYIVLKCGAPAESAVLVPAIVSLFGLYPCIYFIKRHVPISYLDFTRKVILPTLTVSAVSVILPFIVTRMLNESFLSFLLITLLCFFSSGVSIAFIGCTKEERGFAMSFISQKMRKSL